MNKNLRLVSQKAHGHQPRDELIDTHSRIIYYSCHKSIVHSQRWKRKSTVVFNIGYQLIWCTKYRRRVLAKDVETRLKDLLCQKAKQINVETIKTEVMPGHVHLFVKAEPTAPLDYRTDERIHITNPS